MIGLSVSTDMIRDIDERIAEIRIAIEQRDETELAMAEWYPRNDLPAHDDGISLTREMIRVFEEGNEPK